MCANIMAASLRLLGKTTVAEIYRDFLIESKVWSGLKKIPKIERSGFSFQFKEYVRQFHQEVNGLSGGVS
jgi:hypothetical protein